MARRRREEEPMPDPMARDAQLLDQIDEEEEQIPAEPVPEDLAVPEGDQLDEAEENDIVGAGSQPGYQGLPGERTYADMQRYPGRSGPIGEEQIAEAITVLNKYKDGKASLENRVVENEKWWKQRHWEVIKKSEDKAPDPEPSSAWLFNSLANKHADAMDNYPTVSVLPREKSDQPAAKVLSQIMPVIMERNNYEQTYSDAWWYKLKTGTAIYGIFWNSNLENGLGDVDVKSVDILNLFWEPGISDIQKSRNIFHVELVDNDLLEQQYEFLHDKLGGNALETTKYMYDDNVDTTDKTLVIDWYYKVRDEGGRELLHYCKFVAGAVIYASENDDEYKDRGFYDDAQYPFVVDTLFPVEGSPAGFGYIDIMKSPQMQIDKLNQIILRNAYLAGKKRWFTKTGMGVNEEVFADWDKDFIPVEGGSLDEDHLREVQINPLPGFISNFMQFKVDELKETSGNRDFNQGGTASGITAASAIAALQEAGSKLSRDMIKNSYRANQRISTLVFERIRQFYTAERTFRITGEDGQPAFVEFDNRDIQNQDDVSPYTGETISSRRPVFDIKITSEKQSPFNKTAQNEMMKEFYAMGFFNPQNVDQTLLVIDQLDFEGKEDLREKLKKTGTMQDKLAQLGPIALQMAQILDQVGGTPGMNVQQISQILGIESEPQVASQPQPQAVDNTNRSGSDEGEEAQFMQNIRSRATHAAEPGSR